MLRKACEICILLCLEKTWERGCFLEYSIHDKELGSFLLRRRIKKYPDFSRFVAYSKISTLESGFQKLRIRMPDSPDTCGRKPNPQRKKIRIQKYPDTCGRDFNFSDARGYSFSQVPYLEREEKITDQSNFVNDVTKLYSTFPRPPKNWDLKQQWRRRSVRQMSATFSELNFKDCIEVQEKKKKSRCLLFLPSTNVKLGTFTP